MADDKKVKTLSHKIPKLANSALALARQNFNANVQEIASQTVEALGLDPAEGWRVNFDTGFITREVPDDAA